MSDGWDKNEKFVLDKLDEHGDAIQKQEEINKNQSAFNHDIDKRVTSLKEKISWAVAALVVFWTMAGDYIKSSIGKLLP